jgi:hypothetical protein
MSSLRKFYGHHHGLTNRYGISVWQMTTDMFVCRNHNPVLSSFIIFNIYPIYVIFALFMFDDRFNWKIEISRNTSRQMSCPPWIYMRITIWSHTETCLLSFQSLWFLKWFPWSRVAANKEATEPMIEAIGSKVLRSSPSLSHLGPVNRRHTMQWPKRKRGQKSNNRLQNTTLKIEQL